MFSRILVGLDGSDISKTAFIRSLNLAKESDANLHVIMVMTSTHGKGPSESSIMAKSETEARELLETLEKMAKESGVSFTPHLASGSPGEVIISTAENIGADLIVVGSLGKTQMERILLGSVSSYVSKNAKTNILVIRN